MKKRKLLTFENCVFVLYFLVIVLLAFHHEYSRDEFQVWTMVKELNVFEIISQMKYEGHPCLWHLIINLFAELGFSYSIMEVVSCTFSLIGVWIFLHKSPFSKLVKLLMCFNVSFLMYASVFARSYSLILLLIMCLASIYEKRKEKPISYSIILALLVNTHVLVCGLVGMLILRDMYELFIKKEEHNRKNRIIGLIIVFISILLLVLQLYKCFQVRNHSINVSYSLVIVFFKMINVLYRYFLHQCGYTILIALAFILLFVLLYFWKKEKNIMFWIFVGALFYRVIVHTFIYELYFQQSSLIIFDLIFCFWIFNCKNKKINNLFLVIIILTIPQAMNAVYFELTRDFSGSYDAAKFVKNNINSESKILCLEDNFCTPIIGYLDDSDYTFISIDTKKEFSYISWDRSYDKIVYDDEDILNVVKDKKINYIIACNFAHDDLKNGDIYKLIYKSEEETIEQGEKFSIYAVEYEY